VLPLAYCAGGERMGTWRRIQRAPRWAGRRAERKYGGPDGAGMNRKRREGTRAAARKSERCVACAVTVVGCQDRAHE
jgi:hypothetical protein